MEMYGQPSKINEKFETQDLHRQLEAQRAAMNAYDAATGTIRGTQVDPKRDPEITIELRRLDTQICNLQDALRALGTKLQPVTRNEDCAKQQEQLSTPVATTLGSALREASDRIQEMTYRVSQQIDMTEL